MYSAAVVLAALSALASAPLTVVQQAELAIEKRDIASLEAMRFSAYDTDQSALTTKDLIARLSNCTAISKANDPDGGSAMRISYKCGGLKEAPAKCESDILVLHLTRATSPDVFAQLMMKRLDTADCQLPALPMPSSGIDF